MVKIFSYNKQEKLKSRKQIEQLFAEGKSFVVHPIKVTYMLLENSLTNIPIQISVGVSKRNFKNATDRNRIKRLLREAYRLNKLPLHQHLKNANLQIAVFIFYIDKEIAELSTLHQKFLLMNEKLIKQLN
jgi:ribonuclease P protein component